MQSSVFLALGANIGDPCKQINDACDVLDQDPRFRLRHKSSLYRSAPWGITDQPDFINSVIECECAMTPLDCLQRLKEIELLAGRTEGPRWGPRVLDIDILTWGDEVIDAPGLVIPHPRLAQRVFVLRPWAEIAPWFELPGLGSIAALLNACPGRDEIQRLV